MAGASACRSTTDWSVATAGFVLSEFGWQAAIDAAAAATAMNIRMVGFSSGRYNVTVESMFQWRANSAA
jgi:hypothetical protein